MNNIGKPDAENRKSGLTTGRWPEDLTGQSMRRREGHGQRLDAPLRTSNQVPTSLNEQRERSVRFAVVIPCF